jgi:uncharacterized protein (DUF4415 family)
LKVKHDAEIAFERLKREAEITFETLKRARVKDGDRDSDDAPELSREYFERADLRHGDKLVCRGRPRSAAPKQAVKLRLDPDVLAYFRGLGPGWQTRINETLRRAAKLKKMG